MVAHVGVAARAAGGLVVVPVRLRIMTATLERVVEAHVLKGNGLEGAGGGDELQVHRGLLAVLRAVNGGAWLA